MGDLYIQQQVQKINFILLKKTFHPTSFPYFILKSNYTDRTKERIKVYSQIAQIKIEREKLFIHRFHRLNKRKNPGLFTDSTDWTKRRILIYPQIPHIKQKKEYVFIHKLHRLYIEREAWFIHSLHRLNKEKILIYPQITQIEQKKHTDLSTDSTDWTRESKLVYSQIVQIGQKGEY